LERGRPVDYEARATAVAAAAMGVMPAVTGSTALSAAAAGAVAAGETELEEECVVCCEAERSVLLVPCGHLVLCQSCWALMQKRKFMECPVCRVCVD